MKLAGRRAIHARGRDALPFCVLGVALVSLTLLPLVSSATVTYRDAYDILQTFADYGLMALGLGPSMISGEYDISTASLYGLAGMVSVLTGGHNVVFGLLCGMLVGGGVGLLQGTLIARLRMSSVPISFGVFIIVLGVTYLISGNNDVAYPRISVALRLDADVGKIFSLRSLITIGGYVVALILFRLTKLGSETRAVGGDRRAARVAGVRVDSVVILVFAASGLFTAVAGSLHAYSLGSAQPDLGFNPLIFATIAVLLGGVSLAGGRGHPLGIAAGVLSLATLNDILNAIAAPQYTNDLITGIILLGIAVVAAPQAARWWGRNTSAGMKSKISRSRRATGEDSSIEAARPTRGT
jgi:ribose/xylose/arabinose/galactoside ABC-type transport system permease subunit